MDIYDNIDLCEWFLVKVVKTKIPEEFESLYSAIKSSTENGNIGSPNSIAIQKFALIEKLKAVPVQTLKESQVDTLKLLKIWTLFGDNTQNTFDGLFNSSIISEKLSEFIIDYKDLLDHAAKEFKRVKDELEDHAFKHGGRIGTKHYKQAILSLSTTHKNLLERLYYVYPVVDHYELAEKLQYKNVGGVNLQIGALSSEIIRITNFQSIMIKYKDIHTYSPGYISVVHREVIEKSNKYWIMEPNLAGALEELNMVKKLVTN